MITVACVKFGTKYGPEYVNRLKVMVERNLTVPHHFVCYTDDTTNLNCSTILKSESGLDGWWNKLALFQSWMFKGTVLYLDLDTVIQNNIDQLLVYNNKLTGVYTYWNDFYTDSTHLHPMMRYKTPFNSSIMVWKAEDYYWIWDKFNENIDWYIVKYYGDDKFLGNEVADKQTFPGNWIYSRLYGASGTDSPTDRIRLYSGYEEGVYYYPDRKICMFNGPTLEQHYRGFEHYWS